MELHSDPAAVRQAQHSDAVSTGAGELTVGVSRADGHKCSRCWNYSTSLGSDPSHPELCPRCVPVIQKLDFKLPNLETVAA